MTSISLPDPVVRRSGSPAGPAALHEFERDLRLRVDGEVRFDAGSRGAYSTDASNYRQVPIGVVVPRTVAAGAEAVAACCRRPRPPGRDRWRRSRGLIAARSPRRRR